MKSVTKMKMALAVIVFVLLAGRSFAQDTTALSGTVTLDQCIALAIKNNLQINNNRVTADNNQVYVHEAFGNFLPTISANINHSLSEGRVINSVSNTYVTQSTTSAGWGLNFNEVLWNGGAIRNNYQGNKYGYEATKMDLQTQKDNISIQVILAYIQVLSNEEQLMVAKQSVESFRQQTDKASKQNEQGAVSNPADLANFKGQLASAEYNVINLQKAIESSKIALVQYLNVPYTPNFDLEKIPENVEPSAYNGTPDDIYQAALQNLSTIKSSSLKTLSALKYWKAAKGAMWPTVTFGPSAGTSFSSLGTDLQGKKVPYATQLGNNFGSSFGVGLYIPILQGFSLSGRAKLNKIAYDQAKFNENTNKTALQQNIQQAYINVNSGYASYQKLLEEVTDFNEATRIAQVRYNEGVTTVVEYIIAKTSADQAALNLVATKFDYILRTKILDYYQGKLTFK